ncbi:MAG: hypothetical protein Q8R92_04190, partial [Deltaproteobacteria bacterium]|nr:hypothetical protein [Deltaproteobacteria bacterium]
TVGALFDVIEGDYASPDELADARAHDDRIRAEALRDAARGMETEWPDMDHLSPSDWLRLRADAIEHGEYDAPDRGEE